VEGAPDALRRSGDPRVIAFLDAEGEPPSSPRAPSSATPATPR
jgi:hypothetical protein